MDREEYRRHKRLWAEVRDEVDEREKHELNKALTTYREPGRNRQPSLFGRVAFTVVDSPVIELGIWRDRATAYAHDREPGERLTARVDLNDAYEIGRFEPVSKAGELDGLPPPKSHGKLATAADYLLSAAKTRR